jgi:hypothetical protein
MGGSEIVMEIDDDNCDEKLQRLVERAQQTLTIAEELVAQSRVIRRETAKIIGQTEEDSGKIQGKNFEPQAIDFRRTEA